MSYAKTRKLLEYNRKKASQHWCKWCFTKINKYDCTKKLWTSKEKTEITHKVRENICKIYIPGKGLYPKHIDTQITQ